MNTALTKSQEDSIYAAANLIPNIYRLLVKLRDQHELENPGLDELIDKLELVSIISEGPFLGE